MGRNRRQQPSAKQHKQNPRSTRPLRAIGAIDPDQPTMDVPTQVRQAIHLGARSSYGRFLDQALVDSVVDVLLSAAHDGLIDVEIVMSQSLVNKLEELYDGCWQPVDVAHATHRIASAHLMDLLRDVVDVEALRSGAAQRAPRTWLDQLSVVLAGRKSPTAAWPNASHTADVGASPDQIDLLVTRWRTRCGLDISGGLYDSLELLGKLDTLTTLTCIGPVPKRWPATHIDIDIDARDERSTADPKMLARIRALLAKAEATTFPAEADAFTSKAQDLMTRHAIHAAVLHASSFDNEHDLEGDVVARRVHLDNPYSAEKVTLLGAVYRANGARIAWHDTYGFCTVVGLAVDLDLAEVMFTSLLLQATKSVGEASVGPAHTRTRQYRQAFLVAFAIRIGERLGDAVDDATTQATCEYGTSLAPILAARADAVDRQFDKMFPGAGQMRGRSFNLGGWNAGLAAADQAVLDLDRRSIDR